MKQKLYIQVWPRMVVVADTDKVDNSLMSKFKRRGWSHPDIDILVSIHRNRPKNYWDMLNHAI